MRMKRKKSRTVRHDIVKQRVYILDIDLFLSLLLAFMLFFPFCPISNTK